MKKAHNKNLKPAMKSKSKLSPKFKENDYILAYHGQLIYGAKVLKVEEGSTAAYFIHYLNWSKKWDEWVDPGRVMVDNDENRKLMGELEKEIKESLLKKKASNKKRKLTTEAIQHKDLKEKIKMESKRRIKESLIDVVEETESMDGDSKIGIVIPHALKRQLVEDWEKLTKEPRQLVSLPRCPTVNQIFSQYIDYKIKLSKLNTPEQMKQLVELINGLRIYFNRALPLVLLYRFERKQYDSYMKDYADEKLCDIYGAEHLLRLFVRLPFLLSQTPLSETERGHIINQFSDVLKFMQKNSDKIFLQLYNAPPQDYSSDYDA